MVNLKNIFLTITGENAVKRKTYFICFWTVALASIMILTGCSMFSSSTKPENQKPPEEKPAVQAEPGKASVQSLPEAEKLKLAEPILGALLKGMADVNYNAYSENFTQGLKENVTEKDFKYRTEKMKEDIGDLQTKTFIGVLNKSLFDVYLWKAKFSKHNDEQLMRLFLINEDGKYKVYMFNISPF